MPKEDAEMLDDFPYLGWAVTIGAAGHEQGPIDLSVFDAIILIGGAGATRLC